MHKHNIDNTNYSNIQQRMKIKKNRFLLHYKNFQQKKIIQKEDFLIFSVLIFFLI